MVEEGATLAIIFLFLTGVFAILSVPVHFDFYKKYFEENLTITSCRRTLVSYVDSLLSHIVFVSPVILLITLVSFDNVVLSLLIFILLLSEKIFDEIQRFLIFSKQFIYWSNAFLLKSLAPVFIAIGFSTFFNVELIECFVVATILMNALVGLIFIPKFLYPTAYESIKSIRVHLINYVKFFRSQFLSKFLSGLTHANVLNADKWFVTILSVKSLLSEMVLIAQFSNGIAIASNYAFIANRRSELLNKNNSLTTLWHGLKVPMVTLFFGMVLSIAFIVSFYLGVLKLNNLPLLSVLFIVAAYTIYAITEPITEYIFWNGGVKTLVKIDFIYFVLIGILGMVLFLLDILELTSIAFFISMFVRLFMQFILLKKIESI